LSPYTLGSGNVTIHVNAFGFINAVFGEKAPGAMDATDGKDGTDGTNKTDVDPMKFTNACKRFHDGSLDVKKLSNG